MNSYSAPHAAIPLPDLPYTSVLSGPADRLELRPFGTERSDLCIDFSDANRAALITSILENCCLAVEGSLPAEFFTGLSIGKRLECLVRLAVGAGGTAISVPFRCDSCNEVLEIEFTLDEIADQQQLADGESEIEIVVGEKTLRLRRPRGSDQERWSRMEFADEHDAVREMIGTLAARPFDTSSLGDMEIDIVERAIADADPLVSFSVHTNCIACGADNDFEADIGEVALNLLRAEQQGLIYLVHRVASTYHWSEIEVFEIPHWRRMRYLELIDAARKV